MANYPNLPSMQLELLDGNLQAVQQLEGPVVLIVDTAKKGPNASQYVVTDPNKAVSVFGADSPIIESLSKVRFGGAKNVIFYRIGGESAFLKDLITSGSVIETTDKSVSEGAKYFVYFGQPSLSSASGVEGLVKQDDRYLVIKDEKNRIVYSNMVGATINDNRFIVDGFDPSIVNALDGVCKIRIGHIEQMPALEQVIAQPDFAADGSVLTEKDFFGADVAKYQHPGALFAVEDVAVAVPTSLGAGVKQLTNLEVTRGAVDATKSYVGHIQVKVDGVDYAKVALDGTESESKIAGMLASKIAEYKSGSVFDASSSGDEVTVSAKAELAHKVLSFVPNVGAAGAKHVYHLDTQPTNASSTGKIVVRAFHPVTGVEIATEVAITTGTTAADIARGIKTALHANVQLAAVYTISPVDSDLKITLTTLTDVLLPKARMPKVDASSVKGATVTVTEIKGVDEVLPLNVTVVASDVKTGAAPSGAVDPSVLTADLVPVDLTAKIKAVVGHPLTPTNKLFYRKAEYRPTRIALVYTGAVKTKTLAMEVVGKSEAEVKALRAARQEWVYDVPYNAEFSSVEFDPLFADAPIAMSHVSGAAGDFTSTKWDIKLYPKAFRGLNKRDANGVVTGVKDVMLTEAAAVDYSLYVEYDYLVDQLAAVAAYDPTPSVGQGHGPAASLALVASGNKDAPAHYRSGADNIGSGFEKMYEVLDSALDDLETTQATGIYLGSVLFDAPNISDLTKDKWGLVTKADNILRFVRKVQNEDGSIRYEWNNFPVMYKHKADPAKTTSDVTLAKVDNSGNPIIAAKYHEVNFAHRLGMFCHNIVEDEGFILGTIGTSAPKSASTYDVNKWIGVAPTKDAAGLVVANGTGLLGNKYMSSQIAEVSASGKSLKDARPKGFFYTDSGYPDGQVLVDSNGAPIDIGKYLQIVPAVVNMPNFSGFGSSARTTSGAAIYSAILQNVQAGDSTTNRLIPGVTLPFVVKKNKLDDMANAGYVTFITKPAGVTVTSGEVPTWDGSDYQYISTTVIVGDIARKLRARINPFLGKGLNDITLAAMNTAVEQVFLDAVESGAIRKFDFNIIQLPTVKGVGRVAIPSTIVPAFELRKVDSSIKLAYDI